MIKGLGVDLVDIKRIEELINKRGQAFLEKVFTSGRLNTVKAKPPGTSIMQQDLQQKKQL